jgi:HD-GYP domain-containing protein (c-di-GMP phosphodiesterase class II)
MEIGKLRQSSERELYRDLMAHVREKTEEAGRGKGVSIRDTLALAPHLTEHLRGSGDLLEICTADYNPTDLAVSHAVNAACFAWKMAVSLKLSAQDVEDTLVAGLLHDIGLGSLPAFYLDLDAPALARMKTGQLFSDSDRQLAQMHPETGHRAILAENDQARRVAEIIWQHHERADGTGYPRGLKEAEQHVSSRMLAIIDTYEALIHPRLFRDALVPPMGIEAIKRDHPGAFSAEMLKALLRSITLFPVGYHVRLSDGSIAKVIRTNGKHPLRPDVEAVTDINGKAIIPPNEIRLRESSLIHIRECLPRVRQG